MAKIKDVVARGGEYQDRQGNTKVRWINVGSMFKNNEGKVSIKIDAMPVGEWDGWLNLFDPKPRNQTAEKPSNPPQDDGFDDEIPF